MEAPERNEKNWMQQTWEYNSSVTALPAAVALPLALKLPRCCPVIVLITGPSECRVTINFELNWIYFILFAMAPYGVVSQLLALVQWRARAHARVTLVMMMGTQAQRAWVSLPVRLPESGRPRAARTPGSLSGLDCLKLATTKWPAWVAILGL